MAKIIPSPIKVKIMGKMWTMRLANMDTTKKLGECDPDDIPNKEIRIASKLKHQIFLDVALHEILHASNWKMLSEEYVDQLATDIARILWRLGYRNINEENDDQ